MNDLGFVEQHNDLFTRIGKACNAQDIRTLYADVRQFMDLYSGIDAESTKSIYDRYRTKLSNLREENDVVFERTQTRVEKIKKRAYDYSHETDDARAVQDKVRRLMARLPKSKTAANAGMIDNLVTQTIQSGNI